MSTERSHILKNNSVDLSYKLVVSPSMIATIVLTL